MVARGPALSGSLPRRQGSDATQFPDYPDPSHRRDRVIIFDRVTKRYPDGTVAVDALDLEIPDGGITVYWSAPRAAARPRPCG